METIFSTANGYLGMRGGFEEGTPAYEQGVFVNGFHETWPIPYGERAHGFATTGQTIVNVPDGTIIRLYVNDKVFDLARASVIQYERALDLRSAPSIATFSGRRRPANRFAFALAGSSHSRIGIWPPSPMR